MVFGGETKMGLGVFGTPALMINDAVKAVGSLPSREALKKWLQESAALQS